MKKIHMLSALFCASVLSFTGCVEENFERPVPANDGDEIIFGVRAGFEGAGAATKTEYAGEAGYYTIGDKTFERIDWVDDADAIQIYSSEAGGPNPSDYTVHHSKDHDTQKDYAYLSKIGDSSLRWNGDETHHFYAMYPSQALFENMETTLYQGIYMDGTTLHGIVPASQPATITQDGNNWTAAPDMKYAYMAARGTATKEDGSVSLTFVPIVTAVQIQMVLSSDSAEPVSIAEIMVSGDGISGAFTADLSDDGWPEGQTYPTCTNVDAGNGTITISAWKDSKPITVEPGGSLTFTVFLRPGADYKNLKVSYSPTGAGFVGKTMGSDSNPVNIPRNLKTVVKGFNLPAAKKEDEIITIDASKWMSQLDGAAAMKKLSIPGTGGSFSYNYSDESYKQQTLNETDQWKLGIRAFEVVSDRPRYGKTSLGEEYVKCNATSMGKTLYEVLTSLITQVTTNNTETAVLILTYQPEGAWDGFSQRSRNSTLYANSLRVLYDGTTDGTTTASTSYKLTDEQRARIIQYTPDLTLEEARGNIMIFCRINQKDEDDDGSFAEASKILSETNITLIDGCGTGKDRWGSRGYKVQGNVAYDAANTSDKTKSVDYYLTYRHNVGGSFLPDYVYPWEQWSANVTPPTTDDLNFGFSTNYSGITCWYQDWARVVDLQHLGVTTGNYYERSNSVRWYESFNEKVAAAEKTFKMAISDNYPDYVFINSLCGYLVDSSIESSYTVFTGTNTGGMAGNIKGLADKLNPAFYQYVLNAGMEQYTGPTGIVMMDYVTNKPTEGVEYDGSYYLPGVIISNNFKFGSGNSGGSTGGSGSNGDNNTETPGGGSEGDGF